MSTQENMALVRRFSQARAEADLDAMEEMMAPGFISHPLFQNPTARATSGKSPGTSPLFPTSASSSKSSWPRAIR